MVDKQIIILIYKDRPHKVHLKFNLFSTQLFLTEELKQILLRPLLMYLEAPPMLAA